MVITVCDNHYTCHEIIFYKNKIQFKFFPTLLNRNIKKDDKHLIFYKKKLQQISEIMNEWMNYETFP